MTDIRIIEMVIKPPFKYFIMPIGEMLLSKNYYCKTLKEAKEKAENLYLTKKIRCSIYNVYYKDGDWQQRAGWLSNRLLTLDTDCTWYRNYDSFTIHTSFIVNYDVREWNPKLYDRIRKNFIEGIFDYKDDWEFVKNKLEEQMENFDLQVKKACAKVEKKLDAFINANEELTILVQKKYPKINAQYAFFDRMIMFYEENEIGQITNQFQSLEEVKEHYKSVDKIE